MRNAPFKTCLASIFPILLLPIISRAEINPARMTALVERVRACSVVPVTLGAHGQKVEHALYSHCPEVVVSKKGVAQIFLEGHRFLVNLEEGAFTDGDL